METHPFNSMVQRRDEYLTPPEIIKALSSFDLDPCSPINRPWDTAKLHFNVKVDGLAQPWKGRVWLNPPYGRKTLKWLHKMSIHDNGIALIFARTDTKMFHDLVWSQANAILFLKGRLFFYSVEGKQFKHNSGSPSCLVAYGQKNGAILEDSGIEGQFIKLLRSYESP